ncbi:hypothetical protein RchiOBHm_Chr2g0151641 [Rosa chinensis]|uniref:Uncharacterized protein n=1 Tax=Rosa chinensis TaxID=74649 RepID=A0A2P6S084_ROSCH|nr:hypothetical protein RchiOBHm_Chr2g0151641 [Rosa chinensis]
MTTPVRNNMMNKLEDQKRHSNSSDVSPVSGLWTDGLICAFEFVRGHKKVLSAQFVVKNAANKQVSSCELNKSHHSRKNVNNSCESSPKRESGVGRNVKEEGRNCNQDSHSCRLCGREDLPKSCWVPIGWDRISELVQTVQVDDGWDSQKMEFAIDVDDVSVADVAAPYWERPVGPTWWCHVAAGHPCVNSWLRTAQWLHPAVSIAFNYIVSWMSLYHLFHMYILHRFVNASNFLLFDQVPVRVASGLLFELLGQSAGDPYADEDDIPIVLRSWQAQNFLVSALHVKSSAQNINVLGIAEVQELLAAEGITIHELFMKS